HARQQAPEARPRQHVDDIQIRAEDHAGIVAHQLNASAAATLTRCENDQLPISSKSAILSTSAAVRGAVGQVAADHGLGLTLATIMKGSGCDAATGGSQAEAASPCRANAGANQQHEQAAAWMTPREIQRARAEAAAMAGITTGRRCTATVLQVHGDVEPWTVNVIGQVRERVQMWRSYTDLHDHFRGGWRAINEHLSKATKRGCWQAATGPLAAMQLSLKLLGWSAPEPDLWAGRAGGQWQATGNDSADLVEVEAAIEECPTTKEIDHLWTDNANDLRPRALSAPDDSMETAFLVHGLLPGEVRPVDPPPPRGSLEDVRWAVSDASVTWERGTEGYILYEACYSRRGSTIGAVGPAALAWTLKLTRGPVDTISDSWVLVGGWRSLSYMNPSGQVACWWARLRRVIGKGEGGIAGATANKCNSHVGIPTFRRTRQPMGATRGNEMADSYAQRGAEIAAISIAPLVMAPSQRERLLRRVHQRIGAAAAQLASLGHPKLEQGHGKYSLTDWMQNNPCRSMPMVTNMHDRATPVKKSEYAKMLPNGPIHSSHNPSYLHGQCWRRTYGATGSPKTNGNRRVLRLKLPCRCWKTPTDKHQLDRLRNRRPPMPGKTQWSDGTPVPADQQNGRKIKPRTNARARIVKNMGSIADFGDAV
ncbi:unnamed protein product, partial [Prorocentrum cordatum]